VRGGLKLRVNFPEFFLKTLLGGFKACFQCSEIASRCLGLSKFVERFVQLEDFFQQFGRRLLLFLSLFSLALKTQQILYAAHRVAENAIGIIQFRAALQRKLALILAGVNEIVWMELPAQVQEFLLKSAHLDPELAGQAKQLEIAGVLRHC